MEVSINGGTPKSSISMAFSIIKHPFWGNPISGNLRISYAYLQMNFELPIGTEAIICSFCRKEVEIKSAPKNLKMASYQTYLWPLTCQMYPFFYPRIALYIAVDGDVDQSSG